LLSSFVFGKEVLVTLVRSRAKILGLVMCPLINTGITITKIGKKLT